MKLKHKIIVINNITDASTIITYIGNWDRFCYHSHFKFILTGPERRIRISGLFNEFCFNV